MDVAELQRRRRACAVQRRWLALCGVLGLLLGFGTLGLLLWEVTELWRPSPTTVTLQRRLLRGGESEFMLPGAIPGSGVVIVDTRAHVLNTTSAAQVAAQEAEHRAAKQFRGIVGLDRQPPYFTLMTCTAVSSLIQVLIFGPQLLEGGDDTGLAITALQHWSVFVFVVTLLTDFGAVIKVLLSGLSSGEKFGGLALVAATSPNVAVGIMMSALGSLYDNVGFWRKTHRNEDMPSLDEAMLSKGSAFWVYHLLTKFFGAVPGALATLYCVPAFIAYFWLLIPTGALLWIICKTILPCCTACCNGHMVCNDPAMLAAVSGQSAEGFSDFLNAADMPYNPYEAVHENTPAGQTAAAPPASATTAAASSSTDADAEAQPREAPNTSPETSQVLLSSRAEEDEGPAESRTPARESSTGQSSGNAGSARKENAGDGTTGDQGATSSRSGPADRRPSQQSTDDDEDVHAEMLDYLFMRATGAPFGPLFMYYFSCMQMFLLAFFAPAAARLYAGHGYWTALWQTFCDRSFAGWLGSLQGGRDTPPLLCASRWLDAANWFV